MTGATVAQANALANKVVGRDLARRVDGVISVRSDCRMNKPGRRARLFYCDTLVGGGTVWCEASSTARFKHKLRIAWKPSTARCAVPPPPDDPFENDEGPGVDY